MRMQTLGACVWVIGTAGASMLPGCGGKSTTAVGELDTAVEGKECGPAGATAAAADGCNDCQCDGNGKWACTRLACADAGAGGGAGGMGGSNGSAGGKGGAPGSGGSSGGGAICKVGDTMVAPDGCNGCTCTDSGWACTEKACAACAPGESKMIDCNTCTCSDTGQWGCTLKACSVPECTPGDSKKVDCNSCGCTADGLWACTLIFCAPTCPAPMKFTGVCTTVVVWSLDPSNGQCCMYGTPCEAPTGWKTFPSQEACMATPKCPAPVDSGQICPAVIAYAKDPVSGLCCQYSDPCHSPAGWSIFTTEVDCQK